jgi:hypothetical protein
MLIYLVRNVDTTADSSDRAVLTRGSATARLLEWRFQIPPGTWLSVSCECCVLLRSGHCVRLITHPEESYLLWYV